MKRRRLRTADLLLRCMALQRDSYWVAMCLDLDLVVQADTAEQAKRLLRDQIRAYVEEAMTEDVEHASELLSRKAPMRYFAAYYGIKWFNHAKRWLSYEAAVPLFPAKA